jgi:GlpG protein
VVEQIALRVPLDENLAGLSGWLHRRGIPHRITEQAGQQVVWVASAQHAAQVLEAYRHREQLALEQHASSDGSHPGIGSALLWRIRSAPLSCVLILLSCAGALLISSGRLDWLAATSFQPFVLSRGGPVFSSFTAGMAAGEYWRLVTPLFLHFTVLHLVFNALWTWELGGAIERIQGAGRLLLVVGCTGIASNFGQYLYRPDTIFGGLSGVIYGLLGYYWIWQKLVPEETLNLPDMLFWILVVFMFVMMTGIFSALGFGSIANAAHSVGLASGLLLGGVLGWQRRRSLRRF